LLAWTNIILEEALESQGELRRFTILRLARLTRLARLVRIFRLKSMKELNLMVRGIFGGMVTLMWAFVLLFFFIYVLGIFMTEWIAVTESNHKYFTAEASPLFDDLGISMTTLFRCFVGDCSSKTGFPLIVMLQEIYGYLFVFLWVFCIMLVHFGLFNLIMAIYIENTLQTAKSEHESDKLKKKEAFFVGENTKKLLKMFYIVQSYVNEGHIVTRKTLQDVLAQYQVSGIPDTSLSISKDTFLVVLQDPVAHKIMDDLDVPMERDRLFDVLDADGSGTLEMKELIQGILRVRGEAQRSDVLAGVLGVRALLDMFRDFHDEISTLLRELPSKIGAIDRSLIPPCTRVKTL